MNVRVVADRYELEEELGRGGMAVVYRAVDTRLNRHVALKLLHPFLAAQPDSAARFTRESEAVAKLHHPNIVEIFDAGIDEETQSHYIVMELIQGPTLNRFISEHPTKIPEVALAMGCCLADAAAHAHKGGIIHRDIKPENIMISSDGVMKLMDFGIARVLDAERMTVSGSLVGSPAHMPPEIIEGQQYTFSCDIFSLGTVIYYALVNQLPFTGSTPMAVFKAIIDGVYSPPSRINPSVSRDIDRIIATSLSHNPSDRFQTPEALKDAMIPVLDKVHYGGYSELLKKYFANPEEFNRTGVPSIIIALNQSARASINSRRLPAALEDINSILAYDAENAEAKALLRRIRNLDSMRHAVFIGIAAVLVLLVGAGLYFLVPSASSVRAPLVNNESLSDESLNSHFLNGEHAETAQRHSQALPADTIGNHVQAYDGSALTGAGLSMAFATSKDHEDASAASLIQYLSAYSAAPKKSSTDSAQSGVSAIDSANSDKNSADSAQTEAIENHGRKADRTAESDAAPRPSTVRRHAADLSDKTSAKTKPGGSENKAAARDTSKAAEKKEDKINGKPKTEAEQNSSQTASAADAADENDSTAIHITQPVYPPDAFAVIAGKRYKANSSGDIMIDIPPGIYKMTVACAKRCISQTVNLNVGADKTEVTKDIISLDWADAAIKLVEPDGIPVYFVARRLDDHTQRVIYLASRMPNAIGGFNAFGRPIQLEVYAIPKNNTLNSYDINALERAKYASTRVSLTPGESRTVKF